MKRKDLETLKTKKKIDLMKQVSKKKLELAKAVVELKVAQKNNPKKARVLKKDIAQILTVIREKKIIEEEGRISRTGRSSRGENIKRIKRKGIKERPAKARS